MGLFNKKEQHSAICSGLEEAFALIPEGNTRAWELFFKIPADETKIFVNNGEIVGFADPDFSVANRAFWEPHMENEELSQLSKVDLTILPGGGFKEIQEMLPERSDDVRVWFLSQLVRTVIKLRDAFEKGDFEVEAREVTKDVAEALSDPFISSPLENVLQVVAKEEENENTTLSMLSLTESDLTVPVFAVSEGVNPDGKEFYNDFKNFAVSGLSREMPLSLLKENCPGMLFSQVLGAVSELLDEGFIYRIGAETEEVEEFTDFEDLAERDGEGGENADPEFLDDAIEFMVGSDRAKNEEKLNTGEFALPDLTETGENKDESEIEDMPEEVDFSNSTLLEPVDTVEAGVDTMEADVDNVEAPSEFVESPMEPVETVSEGEVGVEPESVSESLLDPSERALKPESEPVAPELGSVAPIMPTLGKRMDRHANRRMAKHRAEKQSNLPFQEAGLEENIETGVESDFGGVLYDPAPKDVTHLNNAETALKLVTASLELANRSGRGKPEDEDLEGLLEMLVNLEHDYVDLQSNIEGMTSAYFEAISTHTDGVAVDEGARKRANSLFAMISKAEEERDGVIGAITGVSDGVLDMLPLYPMLKPLESTIRSRVENLKLVRNTAFYSDSEIAEDSAGVTEGVNNALEQVAEEMGYEEPVAEETTETEARQEDYNPENILINGITGSGKFSTLAKFRQNLLNSEKVKPFIYYRLVRERGFDPLER